MGRPKKSPVATEPKRPRGRPRKDCGPSMMKDLRATRDALCKLAEVFSAINGRVDKLETRVGELEASPTVKNVAAHARHISELRAGSPGVALFED